MGGWISGRCATIASFFEQHLLAIYIIVSTVMFRLDDRLRQTLKASHPAGTGRFLS